MPVSDRVEEHYARGDIVAALLEGLRAAGKDVAHLTPADLAPIDEFHIRGRHASLELAAMMTFDAGMHVLDIGSGLGGPSRLLAETYGCRVTGIDLTAAYCRAATELARLVGLGDRVEYRQADALALPFADASFDAAWTQHVAMNIADKPRLYAEAHRVLKPRACFAIYDILQGEGGPVRFPVPWARDASISFLATPAAMRRLLEDAGFEILAWRDTTAAGRDWFREVSRRIGAGGPPPLGFHLFLGPDFAAMAHNMRRNLDEDRIAPTQIVCRRG